MEVAYADGIDPQSAAGRVSGPRPKRRGQKDDHDPSIRSLPNEDEQRGVKAANQEGEYWSRAYVHAPSIRTQAIDRTMERPKPNPNPELEIS